MNKVADVDCNDLDAIVMWQNSMVEIFKKFGFSKNQLLKLLGEVAGQDSVVRMGTNPTEQVITTAILNSAAKQMVNFSEDHWLAAKQVAAKEWESITVMVDMDSLTKCREEIQNAFLNAAHVPTSLPLDQHLYIVPATDPYEDIGTELQLELEAADPTITEWIQIGLWMNYEMDPLRRFLPGCWSDQIGFTLKHVKVHLQIVESFPMSSGMMMSSSSRLQLAANLQPPWRRGEFG